MLFKKLISFAAITAMVIPSLVAPFSVYAAEPVATDDTYTTTEGDFLWLLDMFDNDFDTDGDPIEISSFTNPSNGSVAITSFGFFSYIPDSGFTGTDSFTYSIRDGQGGFSDPATVTINVVAATVGNNDPVAIDDAYTTTEGQAVAFTTMLNNDTDVDGDTLEIRNFSNPMNGSLQYSGGELIFTPAPGFTGNAFVYYRVKDGRGGYSASSAEITITVTSATPNTAPVANNDSAITDFEIPVSFNVLGNDTDADGDTLETIFFSLPSNGTLVSDINGNITYTPDAGFSGVDTFTYTVSDGTDTDTATVSITVRPEVASSPVAVDDVFPTLFHIYDPSDFWTYNSPFSLLENDSHPDGLEIFAFEETVDIYSDDMSTLYGVLSIFEDGFVSFTPEPSLPVGTYDIEYIYLIYDENDNGDIATLSFTLEVVANSPAVAVDDTYTTDENLAVSGNVLDNDYDLEGDLFVLVSTTPTVNGALDIDGDGSFIYTPNNGFVGTETFTYTISDGENTSTAEVTIIVEALVVNVAPVAVSDSYTTDRNIAVSGNVLTNDTDAESDVLSVVSNTNPTNGTVSINSNGTFTYTPNSGFVGSDTFTYTVSDGTDTATTTVTVTVSGVVLGTNPGNGGAVLPGTGSNAVAIATLALVMFTAVTAAAAYTAKREQF